VKEVQLVVSQLLVAVKYEQVTISTRCFREEKGAMKRGALCNFGFEIPTSEIAAFHLHR